MSRQGPRDQEFTNGAAHVAEVGIPSQRHNRYIDDVDVVTVGPGVVATDVITIGSATTFSAGDGVIILGSDITSTPAINGAHTVSVVTDTTHLELSDGVGGTLNVTATGTTTGTISFVKSVTFTQAEDVRRYRVLAVAQSGGGYMKVVEDAANMAQAAVWLTTASSSAVSDVEYFRVEDGVWSDWRELSKDANDLSLSSLYFAGDDTAGTWHIWVEAE